MKTIYTDVSPRPPSFILPPAITSIEDEAFCGIAAEVVFIHDDCHYIGHRAFAECPNLEQIHLPNECVIEADAFDGSGPGDIVIYGHWDSDAHRFADEHGFWFKEEW